MGDICQWNIKKLSDYLPLTIASRKFNQINTVFQQFSFVKDNEQDAPEDSGNDQNSDENDVEDDFPQDQPEDVNCLL